jgi:hypothetical protein
MPVCGKIESVQRVVRLTGQIEHGLVNPHETLRDLRAEEFSFRVLNSMGILL